ncbi:MAG: dihydrolipoyl dehydrogenase [Candidatus Aminicenantes bacterium]|nr:dihydrolipoyl dehydrogenase [Candidatus Aminicenantes bacterium]
MKEEKTEVAIVGAGPGGYIAALRGSQLGKKITLIEGDKVGGTCTNYGCIPTKFLLHETQILKEARNHPRIKGKEALSLNWSEVQKAKQAIVDRLVKGIEFLLEKNGIRLIRGKARFIDDRRLAVMDCDEETKIEAEKIILATGSRSADLPFLNVDGAKIISSREALDLNSPPESLIIIGAGVIGLEFGSIFARLGTKITILEILSRPLPSFDRQLAERLGRLMKRQGIEIQTQMKIEEAQIFADRVRLKGVCLRTNLPFTIEAEKVLLAAGRRPNSEIVGEIDPSLCHREGFVLVNEFFETRWPGVYAIGDLIGGKLLAHKAMHEGILAIENAFGARHILEPSTVPIAVFTDPELASVGLNEEECQEKGLKVQVGLFPLQASGRAVAMEKSEGLVKIIADENKKIIGAHILAPAASEMIGEMSLAIRLGLKLEDIGRTIHVHPTLNEALAEASLKAMNQAFHLLNE